MLYDGAVDFSVKSKKDLENKKIEQEIKEKIILEYKEISSPFISEKLFVANKLAQIEMDKKAFKNNIIETNTIEAITYIETNYEYLYNEFNHINGNTKIMHDNIIGKLENIFDVFDKAVVSKYLLKYNIYNKRRFNMFKDLIVYIILSVSFILLSLSIYYCASYKELIFKELILFVLVNATISIMITLFIVNNLNFSNIAINRIKKPVKSNKAR